MARRGWTPSTAARCASTGEAGTYTVQASLGPAGLHGTLHLAEPAGGLLGSLAALPAIGAVAADATLDGPLGAIGTELTLTAGPLRARVTGQIDARARSAALALSAAAPAMAPRPDLSWRGITVQGHVRGPFATPDASVTLLAEGLALGQAGIGRISADIEGNAGRLTLAGTLDGIRLPGPLADLLQAAPLAVTAVLRLDAAEYPLTFGLRHPLFSIDGKAALAGEPHGEARIDVPELAPFAAAAGIEVAGRVALTLSAAERGAETRLAAQGNIGVTHAPAPVTALLGQDARLDALATLHGQTVRLTRLTLDGGACSAGVTGAVAPDAVALDWRLAIADLAKLAPTVHGPLSATGKASGSPDDLTLTADLSGEVGAAGIPPGKLGARVTLAGLPDAPAGRVTAFGTLLGAKLDLAVAAAREHGLVHATIERADWKSAHAEGALLVDPAAWLRTQGQVAFAVTRLDDLRPLLGRALGGAVSGKLEATAEGANLAILATAVALPGTAAVARARLDARIGDPLAHPTLDGSLTLDGIAANGVNGAARIEAKGPLDALALRLAATLPALAGAPARIAATGTFAAASHTATIASLQADWKRMPIRLLAPARFDFAAGVAVDRLRIGVRQAELEVRGRLAPALGLTARLRDLPASLAALADPALVLDGSLDAEATLTGNPIRPDGTLRLNARGLRLASGPTRALPAADLTATATLRGGAARLDLRARAGTTRVTVTGNAPLAAAGTFDLRATGALDLALTDPLLTPAGRRARGTVSLDATATGTLAAPRLFGTLRLTDGSFRDFASGIDIRSITASVAADGDTARLARFTAQAGAGTIDASGSLDLAAPGRPIDLTLTARDARPLANDLLTATMNAALTLRGHLGGSLTAAGRVSVTHAEIRVPETLSASAPTLPVRIAGMAPPPPPAPGPDLALDLTIEAPQQVFVRGRGVHAELGGTVHLQGTAATPVPSGGFTLRQGEFSLAGQTLTFNTGRISFNGGSLTDPSLDFTATTSAGGVTATLTIGGTASKPKITLASVPSLPQDEVLAYLLYGQSEATLSPLQIAQIAATLASLVGVAPALSDPLEGLRTAMGLDRLTIAQGSSLQAGRYVARNVYVGAQQSVTGTGTQAVVQVDLAKGLKLQATAGNSTTTSATGTGSGGDAASVGITYQFEY